MKLDERMKQYEYVTRNYLTCRIPVIIRLDGRAFHTFTKGMKKPFDTILVDAMQETMIKLCENIPNCKFGYVQSDEISLILLDTNNTETQAWFNNNLSKILSISASMATLYFNKAFESFLSNKLLLDENFDSLPYERKLGTAMFDSRAFNLPMEEINNYFIWRQQDCIRNSIQMVAQANFSHKELQNLSCKQLIEKLKEKNINYENDFPIYLKRGTCCYKKYTSYNHTEEKENGYRYTQIINRNVWVTDEQMPDLIEDRFFIKEKILND